MCLGQDGLTPLSFFDPAWPANVNHSGLELQLIDGDCFSDNQLHQTNPNIANTNFAAFQGAGSVLECQALHYKGLVFEQEQLCGGLALPKRSTQHLRQSQRQDVPQLICITL